MKTVFIKDLLSTNNQHINQHIQLPCWISHKRHHGRILFLSLTDGTGSIQAVIEQALVGEKSFIEAKKLAVESSVIVSGITQKQGDKQTEISVDRISVVGEVLKTIHPAPRSSFNIFNDEHTPLVLEHRHLYLRNPQVMRVLQFRAELLREIRNWFDEQGFVSIDAPILTPVPLYDNGSAMSITVHDEDVFLTQCVGYYLEAAVHAFEKVYNIGPSFRGEESRSKRHLMEYWHIKAEVAWDTLDDIIQRVEAGIVRVSVLTKHLAHDLERVLEHEPCLDGLDAPFPRISYEDAIKQLAQDGFDAHFGTSLGSREEEHLSVNVVKRPFWIVGVPRSVEPFPYVIDSEDARITRVADLIASRGYGELLGTAEKIHEYPMLLERMREKNLSLEDARYDFVRDVHQIGCVPHAAFGMGVERLIRWLLDIPHVRDAIPFPRVFRRKIRP